MDLAIKLLSIYSGESITDKDIPESWGKPRLNGVSLASMIARTMGLSISGDDLLEEISASLVDPATLLKIKLLNIYGGTQWAFDDPEPAEWTRPINATSYTLLHIIARLFSQTQDDIRKDLGLSGVKIVREARPQDQFDRLLDAAKEYVRKNKKIYGEDVLNIAKEVGATWFVEPSKTKNTKWAGRRTLILRRLAEDGVAICRGKKGGSYYECIEVVVAPPVAGLPPPVAGPTTIAGPVVTTPISSAPPTPAKKPSLTAEEVAVLIKEVLEQAKNDGKSLTSTKEFQKALEEHGFTVSESLVDKGIEIIIGSTIKEILTETADSLRFAQIKEELDQRGWSSDDATISQVLGVLVKKKEINLKKKLYSIKEEVIPATKEETLYTCPNSKFFDRIAFATRKDETRPAQDEWEKLPKGAKAAFGILFEVMCRDGKIVDLSKFRKVDDYPEILEFKATNYKLRIACFRQKKTLFLTNIFQKKEDILPTEKEYRLAQRIQDEHLARPRLRRYNPRRKRRHWVRPY